MKRCETCQHWLRLDYPVKITDNEGLYDQDNPEPAPGAWGYCTMPGFFGPPDATTRAFFQDAAQSAAELYTRSDFGCIDHREPRK